MAQRTLVTLVYSDAAGDRSAITLDVSDDENHNSRLDLTKFPIETGANVNDHAHFEPKQIQINGKVVDFPLRTAPLPALGLPQIFEGREGRANEILDTLLRLQESVTLFEIHARARIYSNMVLASIGGARKSGAMISLSLGFEEVRFADSQYVPIKPTKIKKTTPTQNSGPQTPAPATDSETSKSIAASAVDLLFGGNPPPPMQKAGVK